MKNNKKCVFCGACTALITPFINGEIDYDSLSNLIEFQIASGIDALLVNGTTGESATLSDKEKQELISFASRQVGGRVPLIAGTGSNSTQKAIELTKFAHSEGVDCALVVTPYYNKASAQGLINHYTAIADASELPIILYNVPSRTGVNITIDIYNTLADHKNIVGVKEANTSIGDFAKLSLTCGKRLYLYSGNDDLILPTLSLGSFGVISVLSNLLPKEVALMCKLYFEGRVNEASALQLKLLPLINAIFSEVNPIPIKALLSETGLCKEEYRLPLCPLDKEKRKALIQIAEQYK